MNIILFLVCLAVLCFCSWTDLISGRIPNKAVLPFLLAGVLIQPFLIPFPDYLLRLGIVTAVYFLYEGFIGAGDAKLVMLLIMLCGPVKGLGSLALASFGVLLVSLFRNPAETRKILVRDWFALRTLNAGSLKSTGPKVPLAPYLTGAFILLTVFLGL